MGVEFDLLSLQKSDSMQKTIERWDIVITLLQSIKEEMTLVNASIHDKVQENGHQRMVHVPFRGAELYLLHKSFIDAGGAPHENYRTLLEKIVPYISNKTQKGFSVQSFCKYSDKVCPEAKDNVKRFLQRMIRNIDSYD